MTRAIHPVTHGAPFAVLLIFFECAPLLAPAQPTGNAIYYVDCAASKNGNGTLELPWNSLSAVTNHGLFRPGDSILLKRGTTCNGELTPKGSGTSTNSYIAIDAYGVGPRPIISAGSARSEALRLYNQQYWHVQNIETSGGKNYSVNINGDESIRPLRHIYIANCSFHDSTASSGAALSISQKGHDNTDKAFDDILVDGITVFNSERDGVFISASNTIVRNSTVYNVKGSGVVFAGASNIVADSNVVHDIGNSRHGGNGLWEWMCASCVIQNNEVYNTTDLSNNTDGGAYDIDYNNMDNTVQYNYGHDADGYCISIFGSTDEGLTRITTTNSVVRYNICSNNGRGPAHHARFPQKADILLKTWINGGHQPGFLNGVQIYNNSIYHNPATPIAAIQEDEEVNFTGSLPNFVKNNVIYSSSPNMILTLPGSPITFDNNTYWYRDGEPEFIFRGMKYIGFNQFQRGSGQETHGFFADPLLQDSGYHGDGKPTLQFSPRRGSPVIDKGSDICVGVSACSIGGRDFLAKPVPQGQGFDIGAIEAVP